MRLFVELFFSFCETSPILKISMYKEDVHNERFGNSCYGYHSQRSEKP